MNKQIQTNSQNTDFKLLVKHLDRYLNMETSVCLEKNSINDPT